METASERMYEMRIVTRPDFDGLVCAALLYEAEDIDQPIYWAEPGQIQNGVADIRKDDILANLPHDSRCAMWFDHHLTNKTDVEFKGAFREAPSAAGIIHDYYRGQLGADFRQLVEATDKIDSADLTMDEVRRPEKYPYILLSMTINNQNPEDEPYWNHLIGLLRKKPIEIIMEDSQVADRCEKVVRENKEYEGFLKIHTHVNQHVALTDFRSFEKAPAGNRFLVYSLFPEANVHVKLRIETGKKDILAVNVGHSIFNRTCRVNVGKMLAHYGGGGHPGAGACRMPVSNSEKSITEIIQTLINNKGSN